MARMLGVVFLAAALCLGWAPGLRAEPMDSHARQEIRRLLDTVAKAYEDRDVDTLLSVVAPEGFVAIGAGPNEWYEGLDDLRRAYEEDFARPVEVQVRYEPRYMSRLGSVAWIAGDAPVIVSAGQEQGAYLGRFTAVLVRKKGRWLFVQSHFSVAPDPCCGEDECGEQEDREGEQRL